MSPGSDEVGVPSGFAYRVRKAGEVDITHHGRPSTILRGKAAATFLLKVSRCAEGEAQQLMARVTGNYKRGNERHAGLHPRSRP